MWPVVETSHASQQWAFLLSPQLFAQRVSPVRTVCVLLLLWADCVGGLVDFVGPCSSWLPGSASCGGCWSLVGRAGSQDHWL